MTRKVFENSNFPEEELEKDLSGPPVELSPKLSDYDSLRSKEKEFKVDWFGTEKSLTYNLKIRDQLYQIPKTFNEIKDLLFRVIEVSEDPEGFIDFNGQKYSCTQEQEKYLDRFLFFTYQSSTVI